MLDPEFILVEAESLPYGGTYKGLEGWRELSASIVRQWAGFKLTLLEYISSSENSLVVRFRISGRSRKTRRQFDTTVLELWRFRDNRLLEVHPYYWDTYALMVADTP
jgi:ketosteroid isomerase-like protein